MSSTGEGTMHTKIVIIINLLFPKSIMQLESVCCVCLEQGTGSRIVPKKFPHTKAMNGIKSSLKSTRLQQ